MTTDWNLQIANSLFLSLSLILVACQLIVAKLNSERTYVLGYMLAIELANFAKCSHVLSIGLLVIIVGVLFYGFRISIGVITEAINLPLACLVIMTSSLITLLN